MRIMQVCGYGEVDGEQELDEGQGLTGNHWDQGHW